MSRKILPCKTTRPGTETKTKKSAVSPPLISFGKNEKRILKFIHDHPEDQFSIRGYHRVSGIPRSTISDTLNRLILNGLIEKPHTGTWLITTRGIKIITSIEQKEEGAGSLRRECRVGQNLSQHYNRFTMPILDKKNFNISKIKSLGPYKWKKVQLPNLESTYIYFEDTTIIINPKVIIFRVHDIVSDNSEESMLESMNITFKYIQSLETIGIFGDTLHIDHTAHFARVESILSDFLEKIDENYFIELENGKKFWIDFSDGKREDETNNLKMRERLDDFMEDMFKSNNKLSDLDKMSEVLGMLVKLRVMDNYPGQQLQPKILGRPDYYG